MKKKRGDGKWLLILSVFIVIFLIFFIFSYLYSLNATMPEILNFSSGAAIYSSMVVSNGSLYFGSLDNSIYQLNASDFQKIANYTTGGEVWSTPMVFNNFVYVGSEDHFFYQLNASNISQQIANYIMGGIFQQNSPAVANGYVYVGNYDKKVYQLNASDFSQQIATYTAPKDSPFTNSPAVANGSVYIAENYALLYQLNASNISKQIANYTLQGTIYASSPTVANGYVYEGDYGGHLFQLNASNISQQIANYTTKGGIYYSSPAVANGSLYIGTNGCVFYQLNASNISQQIANYTTYSELVENCWATALVSGNYVYVGNENNTFYQLNASNVSQQIANYTTAGRIFSAPAISGNYIYVGDNSGRVYQLNVSNVAGETAIFVLGACESWSCSEWSGCSAGTQTRTCTDVNVCGTSVNKPKESQSCDSWAAPVKTETETQTVTSVSSGGSGSIEIKNPKIDIRNITIFPKTNISNAFITVLKNETRDIKIAFPAGVIYRAFTINTQAIKNEDLNNVTIDFRVNKTWLAEQNLSYNRVALYRIPSSTETWETLTTISIREDASYYYFSAISPGFSTFVILIKEVIEECTFQQMRCFNEELQSCAENNTWILTEKCQYGCKNRACQGPVSLLFYLVLILITLSILVVTYLLFKKVRRARH